MSGDEVVVLIVSGGGAFIAWLAWYFGPRRIRRLGKPASGRMLLDLAPLIAAAILLFVLRTAAAFDVRDDPRYLSFYFLLGAAWVGLAVRCLPLVGISARDDVVERANRSAACAIGGALIALTLCFAGGNIGDGPGWWVVVFSAGLATLALLVAWLLLEGLAGVSDVVTIDRDEAAGLRLAGFLIACGLIFGAAVTGDWVSATDTVRTFGVVAWPAVILVGAAALVEWQARPTAEHPAPPVVTYGLLPALVYIGAAAMHTYAYWPPAYVP